MFLEDRIDWTAVLGRTCPVCGGVGCYREISSYQRGVIELFPWRAGRIDVARFQCRRTGKTFSLLPCQLAPYHRYTIESMLGVLLLVWQVREESGNGVCAAIDELVGDSNLSPFLVAFWLGAVLRGLRRGHAVLTARYDLSAICSASTRREQYAELHAYCVAFQPRGPPTRRSLNAPARQYALQTGLPLVGIPSQLRSAAAA